MPKRLGPVGLIPTIAERVGSRCSAGNDLIFAGTLVVDFPKDREPTPRQRKQIMEIVDDLIARAQSGQLSNDACLYGWPSEGGRPADAVDVDDDALMTGWIQRSLVIGVRVDPDGERFLWLDSDTLRQGWRLQ
jgi:hypothetical protein